MAKKRLRSYLSPDDEEPSLNLTPLIDVVFVVLILFILIAPMLEVDKVELAAAPVKQTKQQAPQSSPLTIHVHADNSIWIRSKKVSLEQLVPLLKQEKMARPSQMPQLFHDKKAQFGTYQVVKNAVEMAGFEELDVILQPGGV
jgi:biopolymer transport protein ExbD